MYLIVYMLLKYIIISTIMQLNIALLY